MTEPTARPVPLRRALPLAGARLHQPGDVRQLLRLRLHRAAGAAAQQAGLLGREHRPAAGDLQLPEHRHGAHRRLHHRPHRHQEVHAALRRSICFAGAAVTAFPEMPALGAARPARERAAECCSAPTPVAPLISVMAAGRLLFGLGAESLIVAVTTAIARWFKGKELSFAFGINLTIARLGSLAAQVSPSWASWAYTNWQSPLLISRRPRDVLHHRRRGCTGFSRAPRPAGTRSATPGSPTRWCSAISSASAGPTGASSCCASRSTRASSRSRPSRRSTSSTRRHTSAELASWLVGMLTVFAMIGTPTVGAFVDRIGKRALLMMFGIAAPHPGLRS